MNDSRGQTVFIPVDPTTTSSGAIAALVPQLGEEAAKPVKLESETPEFSHFEVVSDAVSSSVATTLDVGSSFGSSLTATDKLFFFDAMAYTERFEQQESPDKVISATRWGVGLRVLLHVSDIKTNISLNFALAGAAVALNQAHAQYRISGIGIGVDGLDIVMKHIPAIGDFTSETHVKLNQAVEDLFKYMQRNKSNLKPQPVAVALRKSIDPLRNARSIYYAMRYVASRRSLNDALSKIKEDEFDSEIVRNVYRQFGQSDNNVEKLSKDAEQDAEKWLKVPGLPNLDVKING
jgi:hypothetical protein